MISIKIGSLGISSARRSIQAVLLLFKPLLINLGDFLFERNSTATLIDHQPLLKNANINEARFEGVRRVENLFYLSELPQTQTVNLVAGDYVMQLWANGNSASITLTGQATGTLAVTAIEHKALSFNVSTSGNVVFTRISTLLKFMLENVTGQTNQNPSEFVLPQWQSQYPQFDGIDNYGYAPFNEQYKLNTNTSISLFAKVDSSIFGRNVILGYDKGAANGWYLSPDNLIYSSYLNDVTLVFPSIYQVWQHYVIVMDRDNSKLKLYIDGIFHNEVIVNFNLSNTESLGIGARVIYNAVFNDNHFNGSVRKLLIYDRVLNQTEITSASNDGVPLTPFRQWNLDDQEGELIAEQTGSGDNIKLKNFNFFPKYYDTENGNTVDGGNNVIEATGALILDVNKKGILIEEQRTNLFLNSDVPVTQIITVVSGQQYSIFVQGTGNIVLSGAATGTITESTPLTATTSSTALTCTVTGSLGRAQVELGAFLTSYIPTILTVITRAADNLSYDLLPVNFPRDFTLLMEIIPLANGGDYTDAQFRLFSTDDSRGTSNQIGTIGDTSYNFDGNNFHLLKSEFSQATKAKIGFTLRQQGINIEAKIVKDGIEKLNTTITGTLDHSNLSILNIGKQSTNYYSGHFRQIRLYNKALSTLEIINL